MRGTSVNTILGGSGFIGRNLAQAIDAFCPPREDLYSLTGNLGHVYHCLGDDSGAVEPNLGYLLWFLKNCQFESLTFISSSRLYLGAASGDEDTPLIIDPADPGCRFNALKIAAEAVCGSDPRCTIARLSTTVGLNNGSYLVPGLIRSAWRDGLMTLDLTPMSERDFITIEDVVEILPKLHSGRYRCYNLASGINTTIWNLVRAIQTATGADATWRGYQRVVFPQISTSRITSEFSFRPSSVLSKIPEICRQYLVSYGNTHVLRSYTPPHIQPCSPIGLGQ